MVAFNFTEWEIECTRKIAETPWPDSIKKDIVVEPSGSGYVYWPTDNGGFYDSALLLKLSLFLEELNKPYFDDMEDYFWENQYALEAQAAEEERQRQHEEELDAQLHNL